VAAQTLWKSYITTLPSLCREIEKQQDMLPDVTVKIGERLENLNDFVDLVIEAVIVEAAEPDPGSRISTKSGWPTFSMEVNGMVSSPSLEKETCHQNSKLQ
jgi:hypothetical protein